jgi:hypothetical protein
MAKKSKIAKNEQRRAVVARYSGRRAELRKIIASPAARPDERTAPLLLRASPVTRTADTAAAGAPKAVR